MRLSLLLASTLLALGFFIVVTPWYILPVCEVYGMYMKTAAGTSIPMVCGWTARAEISTGVGTTLTGAMLLILGKRSETQKALGIIGASLGVFTILFPTYLIGMCADPAHPCNIGTKPSLVLLGSLTVIVSLIVVLKARGE